MARKSFAGNALNVGAGILILVGVAVLALYLLRRTGVAAAGSPIFAGVAPGLVGSGAPSGGGQFGPSSGALSTSGHASPFTPSGGFNVIGGGAPVPTASGGTISVPWLTGPIDFASATSPVRITSPLTEKLPGGTGTMPAGAVVTVINGVPFSLSDFAVSKLGYTSA